MTVRDVTLPPKPPEVPPTSRLTLAQAVSIGMATSPQIKAAHYQVEAAQANYSGQRAPLNPTVSYSGVNNTVAPLDFTNPDNYAFYGTLETSGRLPLRARQARAQMQGAREDARTTGLTVRESVTSAYISLQVANRGLQDEQESYDTALRLRDLTEKQFQAGAAPQTNAIRAQVALTEEAANLFTAISAVKTARASLNVAMGRDPNEPVDAAEPLAYDPIHPNLTELQSQALRVRPEVASGEYARQALSATVGLQRSQYYPDVVVGTSARFDQAFVGFSLPLFDFGSIRGAVHQAEKNVQAQEEQNVQTRRSIELDVKSAYEALLLAGQTVDAYQSGILPQSESLQQRIDRGYALGNNTILDLIDAQNNLRAVRIAYYGAIGSYRTALAQLERAVGNPVAALNTAPAPSAPK